MKKINLTQKVSVKDTNGKEDSHLLGKDYIVFSLALYTQVVQGVTFDEVYQISVLKGKFVAAIEAEKDSLLIEKTEYDLLMKSLKATTPRLPVISDIFQIVKDLEKLPDVPVVEKKK